MIIRIQDGEGIIILSNVDTIAINFKQSYNDYHDTHPYKIYSFNGTRDTKTWLGCYRTMKKSKKVLNLLCEQYQYCQLCKCGGIIGESQPEFIFNMPPDDEV